MAENRRASGSQQPMDYHPSQSQSNPSIDESSDAGGWSPQSHRSTLLPDNVTSPASVATASTLQAMNSPRRPMIHIGEGEKVNFPSMDMLDMLDKPELPAPQLPQERYAINMLAPSQIAAHSHTPEQLSHMRYTAATCDPDGFATSRYSLRRYRQTELLIVVTMSNEDEKSFLRTMNSVIRNVAYLCARNKPWGYDAWQKVVVCIVSDGRSMINPRTLNVLQLMGCYQSGIAKAQVDQENVAAHVFEYTSSTMVSETFEVAQGPTPVQIIFCLKEQSTKKLDSHRWAFHVFGPSIKPKVCILLDVGTKPARESFYELWQCFHRNPLVGGACGEITAETGRWGFVSLLKSPLTAFQHVEQTTSNVFDRPLESVFGYISAMPSAFTAYRYEALLGRPLEMYFNREFEKSKESQGTNSSDDTTMAGQWDQRAETGSDGSKDSTTTRLLRRNMQLSEDQILSFEIVTKKDKAWILKYVKTARASTDVPNTIPEFISQRRSWLNASLFATINAIIFQYRIWTSSQDWFRMILLQLEFLYKTVQALFAWTSLANFYLAFYFLLRSGTTKTDRDAFSWLGHAAGETVFDVFNKIYIGLLLVVLVCSLGNRLQGSSLIYSIVAGLFGICGAVALWSAGFSVRVVVERWYSEKGSVGNLLVDGTLRDVTLPLAATCTLYLVTVCLHENPWPMLCSVLQYMFLLPSYVNILAAFTMCNFNHPDGETNDISLEKIVEHASTDKENANSAWDSSMMELLQPTRDSVVRDEVTKGASRARNLRTNVVLAWMCTNLIMMAFFTSDTYLHLSEKRGEESVGGLFNPYLAFLCYSLFLSTLIHFLGSSLYLVLLLHDVWTYQVIAKQDILARDMAPGRLEIIQGSQAQRAMPMSKSSSFPATRHDPRAPKASGLSARLTALRGGYRRSRAQGSLRGVPVHPDATTASVEKL